MSPTILPFDSALNGFPVLGLPVHLTNNYTNWLLERWQQGLGTHVITLNAEMAIQGEKDPKLAEITDLNGIEMYDGDGWILQTCSTGWWLFVYPYTFIEWSPGCVALNYTTPHNAQSEFGFDWITQYYLQRFLPKMFALNC